MLQPLTRVSSSAFRIFSAPKTRQLLVFAALAFVLALLVDTAAITWSGADTPLIGDADQFADAARSLASNHGFFLKRSFWPNTPDTSRSPLYPVLLSVTLRLFPDAQDAPASRGTNALLHALTAALMVILAYQISRKAWVAGLCGVALALYPPEIALVVGGFSEIAFLLAMMLGVILLLKGGNAAFLGAVICGVSALARSNFLLLPIFVALLLLAFRPAALFRKRNLGRVALLCAVYYLFPTLWMIRNYSVTGVFPLFSSLEGETLYGANNAFVANDLSQWGYWAFPDRIPGEQTKATLALTRSEVELDRYYHGKATEFLKSNGPALPRLELGKLIRGFIPLPWAPLASSYVVFAPRLLMYLLFGIALAYWKDRQQLYTVLLGAISLVIVATTVIYYGTFRFTFCLEPFLLPVMAAALAGRSRQDKVDSLRLTIQLPWRRSMAGTPESS